MAGGEQGFGRSYLADDGAVEVTRGGGQGDAGALDPIHSLVLSIERIERERDPLLLGLGVGFYRARAALHRIPDVSTPSPAAYRVFSLAFSIEKCDTPGLVRCWVERRGHYERHRDAGRVRGHVPLTALMETRGRAVVAIEAAAG